MKIIRAIVAGERGLGVLASHRDVRCRASTETIKRASMGISGEHILCADPSLDL